MIKTVIHEGKTITFKCTMENHAIDDCKNEKHCKMEALRMPL